MFEDIFKIKPTYIPPKEKEQPQIREKFLSEEELRKQKIKKLFDDPIWTTKKIQIYDKLLETGEALSLDLPSPYLYNEFGVFKSTLNFKRTEEEDIEYELCKNDPVYFADKYCYSMTDLGVVNIELRPYQKRILKELHEHRFSVWLASRQIGKCFTGDTEIQLIDEAIAFHELYYNYSKKTFLGRVKNVLYKILKKINI